LDEQEISEIQTRIEAATPGPWEWSYHPSHHDDVIALEGSINGIGTDVLLCTSDEDGAWGEISPEDDSFIAHARTDVEILLAEVARLRGIISLTEARDALQRPERQTGTVAAMASKEQGTIP
jgi:hypothetical protein